MTGYQVERCTGAGCTSLTRIATPAAPPFSDTGLTAGTTYRYQVRATDAAGNFSPYSNVASATTPATVSGLVAAYGFEEGSGFSVADSSGRNTAERHGRGVTTANAARRWPSSRISARVSISDRPACASPPP